MKTRFYVLGLFASTLFAVTIANAQQVVGEPNGAIGPFEAADTPNLQSTQPAVPATTGQFGVMDAELQRGELGVWLAASPGPGVEIRQITSGSAADHAGLQPGDVLLQINGRGVMSPSEVQQLIRATPAGQLTTLEIWRNGATQEIDVTLQPLRAEYQVGFRGNATSGANNSELASRTSRLEEQLAMVMRELQQLRVEISQMQSVDVEATTSFEERPQPVPAAAGFEGIPQSPPQTGIGDTFGEAEATQTIQPVPPVPTQPAEEAFPPASSPVPASEPADDDLFGDASEPLDSEPTEPAEAEADVATESDVEVDADADADPLF